MEQETKPTISYSGAVLYTDGSCMPNPGYGGWGIHGYTYTYEEGKIPPASQKKNIITNCGYRDLHDLGEVIPSTETKIEFVKKNDTITAYGTPDVQEVTNNNKMELLAVDKGLRWIADIKKDYPIDHVYILIDNMGVLGAMTHWYDKWKKANWLKSDGTEVKMRHEIEAAHDILKKLRENTVVKFEHVKGHSNNLGNDQADKLAKRGSHLSKLNQVLDYKQLGKPNNKKVISYNEFFTKNRWYFMGGKQHTDNPPKIKDWFVYYTGALGHGKKDENFGVHAADGYSAIILTKEQEPALKRVEEIYRERCSHDYDFVVAGNLTTVLTPESYHDIMDDADKLVVPDNQGKTLVLPTGKVVCMEYNPAHLSYIQMDRHRMMQDIIEDYLEGKTDKIVITDITTQVITSEKKGKQVVYTSAKGLQHNRCVKVDVGYDKDKTTSLKLTSKTDKDKTTSLKLTSKTDIAEHPHLNKLAKLHGDKLKVEVITRMISPEAFRFCVVVKTDDAMGFWMNFDSSLIYLS